MTRLILLLCLIVASSSRLVSADEPTETMKVITHNVWYGFTQRGEPRRSQWLNWMAEQAPDVVALQELNGYTPDRLAADARQWGHLHSVLLKEEGFPTGITSRFPISDVRRIREGMHHGLLRCRIRGIWFYVIHFHPSNFASRIEEAGHLQADVATLPELNPKVILAGDFNGFSPADRSHYDTDLELEPFFEMLDRHNPGARNLNEGKLDYGGLEAILSQGYVDLVDRFRGRSQPFVGTFPTSLVGDQNHGTDRRLDYLFVSPNLLPQVESAWILKDEITRRLSDHLPVTATLRL
ncbi:endonuclease/exonuclease/phosphatase family protein [Neorhodopirellula pilleata]|uniref:Endonuclease/Exonuclease/phosphatase family protein n=1 Tax=Neorhodopirellula pilleata TaxID=2714738 RepID=A0A5C6AXR4_9BACT|nr:endonuclease/exonuclease/phosphatase family protein [Neorhodopirellula pilleata]TWU03969.1 Endonuclease/Exonuclease/phosphatase family protein [Neorhodopirellula pilleata]